MTTEENKNKVLSIFYNYKETADALPKKYRGQFWELVINYAFDGENAVKNELEVCNKYVKIAFFSIKNLLKLNKKAGSQNGKSNNPSGLSKTTEPNIGANTGANITPIPYIKENKRKENKIKNNPNQDGLLDLKEPVCKNKNYEVLVGKYPNLKEPMERWLKYKNERKDKYTDTGLEDCFEKLQKLSGGDVITAMKIVKQSTSNNWAGLFPLRGNVVLDEKPVREWKGICTDILVLSRATYEERQKWSEKQKRVFDKLCRHEPLTEEDVNE